MALKDKYSTVSEAAKELGVTRQTVSRWISDGKLVAETVGREKLIDKEQLNKFEDRRISAMLFKYIDRGFIAHIREQYNYTQRDVIKRFDGKSDPLAIGYSVVRADGTHEEVWIDIGKIDMKEDGLMDFEIKKVTRTVKSGRRSKTNR